MQSTKHRLSNLMASYSIPYILMSLSYEPIFLFVLSINLEFWQKMEIDRTNKLQVSILICIRLRNHYNKLSSFRLLVEAHQRHMIFAKPILL